MQPACLSCACRTERTGSYCGAASRPAAVHRLGCQLGCQRLELARWRVRTSANSASWKMSRVGLEPTTLCLKGRRGDAHGVLLRIFLYRSRGPDFRDVPSLPPFSIG